MMVWLRLTAGVGVVVVEVDLTILWIWRLGPDAC